MEAARPEYWSAFASSSAVARDGQRLLSKAAAAYTVNTGRARHGGARRGQHQKGFLPAAAALLVVLVVPREGGKERVMRYRLKGSDWPLLPVTVRMKTTTLGCCCCNSSPWLLPCGRRTRPSRNRSGGLGNLDFSLSTPTDNGVVFEMNVYFVYLWRLYVCFLTNLYWLLQRLLVL